MRPNHPGLFHVAARSNAEERIFRDDRDYLAAVQLLAELTVAGYFVCHEFCVMPTHYHLLGTFEANKLTPAIHHLNRRYASGFNRRHGRRGKVFDSPFVSTEVTTEQHAVRLPAYLAENPPWRPWPWSSADAHFEFVQRLAWLETLEPGSNPEPGSEGMDPDSRFEPDP